jgi:hypothetical protein
MDDQQLLERLPLVRTWLADIVAALLTRSKGEGEIDTIVTALLKTDREVGAEPESTVTRTINNYCINAGDTREKVRPPLFERTGPGRYRLLTYPNSPDLIEIQDIRFSSYAHQRLWGYFVEANKNPKWKTMSKRDRLITFSRTIIENEQFKKLLEAYQNAFAFDM